MSLRRNAPRAPAHTRDQIDQLMEKGDPIVLRIDEIVGEDAVRGTLLVPALGRRHDQQIVVHDIFDGPRARSLRAAIQGTKWIAPLAPADVVTFESGFELGGKIRSGKVSGRTHGRMPGDVQVISAMARPSDAVVNKKGALQSLTIASGADARSARTPEKVVEVLDWARAQAWPGGAAGVIMRDRFRNTREFFEERGLDSRALLEDLEGILRGPDDLIEVIPAWRVQMGFEQVTRDVDPTKPTTSPVSGPFSRRFSLGNGRKGFVPCLVILADEEERAFGGLTGRMIRVAAGVQPIDKLPAIPREELPSKVRAKDGKPNGIIKLYDEETVKLMAEERAERYPRSDAPGAATAPGRDRRDQARRASEHEEDDEREYRPKPAMGGGGLRAGGSRPVARRF